jgi:hypothetical protein
MGRVEIVGVVLESGQPWLCHRLKSRRNSPKGLIRFPNGVNKSSNALPAKGVPTGLRDDKIRALNDHFERLTMGYIAYKATLETDGFVAAPEFAK